MKKEITFLPIGEVRTPFKEGDCPFQPPENGEGEAEIIIYPEFQDGLFELNSFKYIYVLFYCHRCRPYKLRVKPPWLAGKEVGVFASRSPNRPNSIGLSIVRLKRIENGKIITSLIDAYDKSPVLDIKPYFKSLDCKQDANIGWLEGNEQGCKHLQKHLQGIPVDESSDT